jgi:hypothetical protein
MKTKMVFGRVQMNEDEAVSVREKNMEEDV